MWTLTFCMTLKFFIKHNIPWVENMSYFHFPAAHQTRRSTTKTVWVVHTTTTWHVQSTTQYQIKLRLKIEKGLTANLEHVEVLSHSILYFFSTAMLVQKLPLGALIPYTPQTWRKHLLYWCNWVIVRILSCFIFVYSMNCAYQYAMKILFCE
jgi:hypothetical protein